MKKLPDNWKNLDKIILNLMTINYLFNLENDKIILNCTFENIAKGRCLLTVLKEKNNSIGNVVIFSDKAMMEISIFYKNVFFEKVLLWITKKQNVKKKLVLTLSKGLFINKNNYLHVEKNTNVQIIDTEWIIPLN